MYGKQYSGCCLTRVVTYRDCFHCSLVGTAGCRVSIFDCHGIMLALQGDVVGLVGRAPAGFR